MLIGWPTHHRMWAGVDSTNQGRTSRLDCDRRNQDRTPSLRAHVSGASFVNDVERETVTVSHATKEELSGFVAERWKCHENRFFLIRELMLK